MKTIHWLLLLLVMGACKDKYNAPIHIPATGYLVVEGFINAGSGTTDIMLSRATGLDSPYVLPEYGALVSVESANGSSYPLTELTGGHYSVGQIPVDVNQQYRIRIKTSLGKEYLSDLSAVKITPEIDSVSWKPDADGVWIYVSTHDSQNNSRYYQWQYEETWQYTSSYATTLKYQDYGKIVYRPDSEMIYTCWSSDLSTDIDIASSAKFTTDVIYEFPLTRIIYAATDKLSRRYSILVKQHALTEDWYSWNEKIKKNTEQLGSIFDAQPSEIAGNIHCTTDPNEPVIGFIGCATQTEKRIFIDRSQLPSVTNMYNAYAGCNRLDTVKNDPDTVAYFFGSGYDIPIEQIGRGNTIISISGSSIGCVDCRERGGTTTKPDFWQ